MKNSVWLAILALGGCVHYPDVPLPGSGACVEEKHRRHIPSVYKIGGNEVAAPDAQKLLLGDPLSEHAEHRALAFEHRASAMRIANGVLLLAGLSAGAVGFAIDNDNLAAAGISGGIVLGVAMAFTGLGLDLTGAREHRHAVAIINSEALIEGRCPPSS